MDEDLVNLKKYPAVMYMNMYGNGKQTWDTMPNDIFSKHEHIFETVFSAKYIRADIVLEEIDRRVARVTEYFEKEQTNDTE